MALPAVAGVAEVRFVDSERFADIGRSVVERERAMAAEFPEMSAFYGDFAKTVEKKQQEIRLQAREVNKLIRKILHPIGIICLRRHPHNTRLNKRRYQSNTLGFITMLVRYERMPINTCSF